MKRTGNDGISPAHPGLEGLVYTPPAAEQSTVNGAKHPAAEEVEGGNTTAVP